MTDDLAAGKLFADCQFDDVFTELVYADGECLTTIEDLASGRKLSVAFSDGFTHCVVYNPQHREAICIEPYTCAPGMFGQDGAARCEDVLRILPPGGSVRLKMRISAE